MNNIIVLIVIGVLMFGMHGVQADEYPQRWNYMSGHVLTDDSTKALIETVEKSGKAGCTHILWAGSRGFRIPEMTKAQLRNVRKLQAAAKKAKVKIIPGMVSIGYSGRYFHVDSNLAAGVPVKNMPYIVKDGKGIPDPALALDASKLKKESGRVRATYAVKPFMYYKVTFYMSKKPGNREGLVEVSSSGGKRRNCRTNATITEEDGKFFVQTVFNTLEGDKINFQIKAGNAQVTDVKIEPAGTLLILRRDRIPLVVTNEDGTITYTEGRDFRKVEDPIVIVKPFPGEFPIDHPATPITLTRKSRIKDGDKLKVSFFHHVRIYSDQDLISLEDPATWDIYEQEIREVTKLWPSEGYCLNYDEIRVAGWERQDGEHLKPGPMLAQHFKRAYDLLRKYAPKAEIYTWSDMFTPYHNARPFKDKGYYYLVNGNWDGAWEGVPEDVIMLNWYSPDTKTIKFLADRGHEQVLCGYYDSRNTGKMKQNISKWKKVSRGLPGMRGFMYTTWRKEYDHMEEYFTLLDSFEEWNQ